jgi:hypothetical protein
MRRFSAKKMQKRAAMSPFNSSKPLAKGHQFPPVAGSKARKWADSTFRKSNLGLCCLI